MEDLAEAAVLAVAEDANATEPERIFAQRRLGAGASFFNFRAVLIPTRRSIHSSFKQRAEIFFTQNPHAKFLGFLEL